MYENHSEDRLVNRNHVKRRVTARLGQHLRLGLYESTECRLVNRHYVNIQTVNIFPAWPGLHGKLSDKLLFMHSEVITPSAHARTPVANAERFRRMTQE